MYMSICFLMMYIFYISHSIEYRSFFFIRRDIFFLGIIIIKKNWWWNLNTIVVNETHIHRHRHPSINSMHFIRIFFDDNDDDGIDMDWFALPSEINRLIHYNSNFDPIFLLKKILIWIVEFLPFFKEFCHYEIYFF